MAQPNVVGNSGAYDPSYLQSAYNLTQAAASAGAGQTVAIVDAYDDPTAESDLAYYRSFFGLPACTTADGCFRKVNQNGVQGSYPSSNSGWAQEISLDLDMVSALCPNCRILLVEASSASYTNLGTSVNAAASLGANVISNSYGGGEVSSENSYDAAYYNHPGIAITVSSGDNGYGVEYPAASPYVTAVGGTTLNQATNTGARNATETAWSGTGSGCSAYETKPAWQNDSACSRRTVADVAAVADPNTGVWVYDGGWYIFGGTSVAAPIIGSVYALAGNSGVNYGSTPYSHVPALFDVTSGSNGSCGSSYLCTAVTGYDGPTGLGTPNATAGFTASANITNDFSISALPSSLSIQQGGTGKSSISTATIQGSSQTVTLSVTGVPAGASASLSPTSVSSGSGSTLTVTTGTAAAGTYTLTVTGSGASATHSTAVSLTVTSPGGGGGIVNGGFETGNLSGWTPSGTASVTTTNPHSGSYAAMLGGTTPTNGDSSVAQTFVAPAGTTTLTFWYDISCPDTVRYDWATVRLRDNTTGATTTVLGKTCLFNSGWRSQNARIVAGHNYTLTLTSHDDNYSGDPTYTLYDDVSAH